MPPPHHDLYSSPGTLWSRCPWHLAHRRPPTAMSPGTSFSITRVWSVTRSISAIQRACLKHSCSAPQTMNWNLCLARPRGGTYAPWGLIGLQTVRQCLPPTTNPASQDLRSSPLKNVSTYICLSSQTSTQRGESATPVSAMPFLLARFLLQPPLRVPHFSDPC